MHKKIPKVAISVREEFQVKYKYKQQTIQKGENPNDVVKTSTEQVISKWVKWSKTGIKVSSKA